MDFMENVEKETEPLRVWQASGHYAWAFSDFFMCNDYMLYISQREDKV